MKIQKLLHHSTSLLLLLVCILTLVGCATAEPDNLSVRPWNAPQGWENGLPSGLMEGR